MKRTSFIVAVLALLTTLFTTGCAVILGKEEGGQSGGPGLHLQFMETLRNQASLRGESYREIAVPTDPSSLLQFPSAVYADQFRVYVTDKTVPARIVIFDRSDRTATILNITSLQPSSHEGKLLNPSGISVDGTGLIYVSDSQLGRIFGYDRTGKLLFVLGRAGDLSSPAGLAIDQFRNRIYVADKGSHQIKVLSPGTGQYLLDVGRAGSIGDDLKAPSAICLDRSGNLYAVDSVRMRVLIYNPEGVLLRNFSLKGSVPGLSIKPTGIAVDSDGHVYVADAVKNYILIYNPDGTLLSTWGRNGLLAGDFWTPSGIFIDDHDTIYIADQTNGRIQTFHYLR